MNKQTDLNEMAKESPVSDGKRDGHVAKMKETRPRFGKKF